ncbi:MAG TPA: hypothetical protein VHS33_12070 [Sphingomicrobium sp.]|jgi:hypothetical protein|nr:hypothetical protein [Sphingomicrobium sp.]
MKLDARCKESFGARITIARGEKVMVCGEMLGTFIVLRDTSDVEQHVRG